MDYSLMLNDMFLMLYTYAELYITYSILRLDHLDLVNLARSVTATNVSGSRPPAFIL